jgi:hypothetical protein
MADSATITLYLHCQICGRPLTLRYQCIQGAWNPGIYKCPNHMCSVEQSFRLDGEILNVWAGHNPTHPDLPRRN